MPTHRRATCTAYGQECTLTVEAAPPPAEAAAASAAPAAPTTRFVARTAAGAAFEGATPTAPLTKLALALGQPATLGGMQAFGLLAPPVQRALRGAAAAAGLPLDEPVAQLAGQLHQGLQLAGQAAATSAPSLQVGGCGGVLDWQGGRPGAFPASHRTCQSLPPSCCPCRHGWSWRQLAQLPACRRHPPSRTRRPRSMAGTAARRCRARRCPCTRRALAAQRCSPAPLPPSLSRRRLRAAQQLARPRAKPSWRRCWRGRPRAASCAAPPPPVRAVGVLRCCLAGKADGEERCACTDAHMVPAPPAGAAAGAGNGGRAWTAYTAYGLKNREAVRAANPGCGAREVEKVGAGCWELLMAACCGPCMLCTGQTHAAAPALFPSAHPSAAAGPALGRAARRRAGAIPGAGSARAPEQRRRPGGAGAVSGPGGRRREQAPPASFAQLDRSLDAPLGLKSLQVGERQRGGPAGRGR